MMLMEWGIKIADHLGVDCFVEGSQTGVPLYLQHGFEIIENRVVKPVIKDEDKSKEWKEMEGTMIETLSMMRRRPKSVVDRRSSR
jgi:hypothetical protein